MPVLIIYLCKISPFLNKIGAILLAYALGLIIGNVGILPGSSFKSLELITNITVPLALPLLLFSSNLHRWSKIAGRTMLSIVLAIVALLIVIYFGNEWFKNKIENIWQVSGLLVGVYTGGTFNMAAIKLALGVDNNLYLMTHTSDMIGGAIYLLFVISVAQRILQLVLPKFSLNVKAGDNESDFNKDYESYEGIFRKDILKQLALALGLTILISGIGVSFTFFLPEKFAMTIVILTISSLGVVFSLSPKVRKLEKTFQLGMYFILVFSLAVASMGSIEKLLHSAPYVFYYVSYVITASFILHVIFSAFFKIDADTTIITSVALILSAPFVPTVAGSLKNKDIIISGLTAGIIGYAIGNHIGVAVAYFLQ